MNTRIKINGKTGVLGNDIVVSQDGTNQVKVTVRVEFSKRYLKYLTKKFLKAQKLRDYIHVIAKEKNSYFLKYYNFHQEEEEEEE